MNAELINIGNELLLGLVTNTHAVYLGRELTRLGFDLDRQICVGDDPEHIKEALKESLQRADLVIATGGLGPTSDDITAQTIVDFFGLRFCIDQKVEKSNEAWFQSRGMPMPELVKKQALVPENATVLYNDRGTAPGFILQVPASLFSLKVRARWLVVLPGPPRELRPMFKESVIPFFEDKFKKRDKVDCRILQLADIGESIVQEQVEDKLKQNFPSLIIGYCARPGQVDLRLLVKNEEGVAVQAEAMARELLGNHVFGEGDIELEEVVVQLLREKKKTVVTAESCTGGALANRLTNVPGASEVFLRGWITYSNQSKIEELGVNKETLEKFGAVSEPTASEIAQGALKKSGADFALAVTGIAGPDGGTPEKPVGTVFIALATKDGVKVLKEVYPSDRLTFKWRVAQTALNLLRLSLVSKKE